MNEDISTEHLEEGVLYVLRKGVLEEIQTDPDDAMRKIKITECAYLQAVEVQNIMRKSMSGFKPDMTTIASALIKHAAKSPLAKTVVKDFTIELYQTINKGE